MAKSKGKGTKKVPKNVKDYINKELTVAQEPKQAALLAVSQLTTVNGLTTGQLLLNGIGSGSFNYQRIGDRVRLHSMDFQGNLSNGTVVQRNVRIMVVLDKQPNASTIVPANFLPATALYNSFYSLDAIPSRYHVLYDKLYNMGVQGGATDIIDQRNFRIRKRWKKGILVQYLQGFSTAGIGDISTNALWLLAIVDNGTTPPTLTGSSIVRYVDA